MQQLFNYAAIKDKAFFQGQGREKVEKVNLLIAQAERQLKNELLCDGQFDSMLAGYDLELYNLCLEYVAWYTYLLYLPFAQIHDTDTGLRGFTDQNSNASPQLDLKQAQKNIEGFVMLAKRDIERYNYECLKNRCDKHLITFKITGA